MRRARGDEPSFTQLAETGGGVVFRVRVPSPFAVEYLSPSVQDLSGRTPEEFYANPDLIFEVAQADDRGKLRALFASQSRVILPATIRFSHLDGSTVWVEFTGVPVHDDAGEVTAFEGIARDITLPMAAERELETERNFVTGILNTTDALVVVLDPAGRIVSLNRACERLSGYTNEESRDLPVWDFARPPEQAEGVRVLFEAVKVDNFPRRRENEWLLRDGGRRLIAWSDTAMLNSSGGVDFVIASGVDVTDQHLAERQTRLLGTALESAADMVVITDEDGVVRYVNEAFTRDTGYSRDETIGTTPEILRPGRQSKAFHERLWRTLKAGKVWAGELVERRKDGTEYYEDQTITPVTDPTTGAIHFIAIKRDVTERRRVEEELQRLATTDTMTGLLNRHQFTVMLDQSLRMAQRRGSQGALIYLDLDALKYVNDTYGHSAGDEALKAVAGSFREGVRASDIVARVGGDEFGVVLHDVTSEAALAKAGELVRRVSELGITVAGERVQLSCSAGLAPFPIEGVTVDELRSYADMALYKAKEEGRSTAYLYDPAEGRIETVTALQRTRNVIMDALDEDRFVLFRQPIVDLSARQITMYEVLVRLRDREGNLRLPGEFIPGAEDLGIVHLLDRRIVERAFDLWQEYDRAGEDLRLSINVSALSAGPDTAHFIIEEARARGVRPELITFEVTETATIRAGPRAQRFVSVLCDVGFTLALDDFGTGTASFRAIRDLSFKYLKLDGSLVQPLRTDSFSRDLVRGLVDLAHTLGLEVIAEFVQDEETVQFLASIGAEYGQGYYLGEPEAFPAPAGPGRDRGSTPADR